MNILELLKILSEDIKIDEFNKKVEGKISKELLDAFASKMKKGKYNNAALAVLKGIQEADEEHREVLEKKALAIYGLFRQMKKGDSSFNASEIIDEFLKSEDPKTFWRDKYSQSKEEKKEKKEDFGLKNVRVKKLKNYYLIFPKTFYNNYYFSKREDFNKGWQELKAISDEMAKKDTSKVEANHVNHWCVASSSQSYFDRYKNDGGLFVVVVKKNKDGSPDWNHRYLWYTEGKREEFADKKDKHLDIEDLKDPELIQLIEKIKTNFKDSIKKDKAISRAEDSRIKQIEKETRKNLYKPKTKEELIKEFPKAEQMIENTNKINKFFSENERDIYKDVLYQIISKKYPEILTGKNIIKMLKSKSLEGHNSSGYNYSLTIGEKPFSLQLNKNGNIVSLTWGYARWYVNSEEEVSEVLEEYFKKKEQKYEPDAINIWGSRGSFQKLKNNSKFSNKYGPEIAQNILKQNSDIFNDIHFPFAFNLKINLDGIFYSNKLNFENPVFICKTDDPNALEKVKTTYGEYLKKRFPDYEPNF